MPLDPDHPDLVRDALEAAETVDARRIRVESADDAVVLRGSVATFEQASAAAMIAEQHADQVRSELTVDTNLREAAGMSETQPAAVASRDATGSAFDPAGRPDDLVTDVQDSLDENVPWQPPHEAVEVPTRAEERGVADQGGGEEPAAGGGPDATADPADKSLPGLSPEELARAAHPEPRDEEDVRP